MCIRMHITLSRLNIYIHTYGEKYGYNFDKNKRKNLLFYRNDDCYWRVSHGDGAFTDTYLHYAGKQKQKKNYREGLLFYLSVFTDLHKRIRIQCMYYNDRS